jgi:hypothetical protein
MGRSTKAFNIAGPSTLDFFFSLGCMAMMVMATFQLWLTCYSRIIDIYIATEQVQSLSIPKVSLVLKSNMFMVIVGNKGPPCTKPMNTFIINNYEH